jgi:hypothetical protein
VPEVAFPQCSLGFSRGALLNDSDRELALRVLGGECGERVGRLCQLVGVLDVHTQSIATPIPGRRAATTADATASTGTRPTASPPTLGRTGSVCSQPGTLPHRRASMTRTREPTSATVTTCDLTTTDRSTSTSSTTLPRETHRTGYPHPKASSTSARGSTTRSRRRSTAAGSRPQSREPSGHHTACVSIRESQTRRAPIHEA